MIGNWIQKKAKKDHGDLQQATNITHEIDKIIHTSFMIHSLRAQKYIYFVKSLYLFFFIQLCMLKLFSDLEELAFIGGLPEIYNCILSFKNMLLQKNHSILVSAVEKKVIIESNGLLLHNKGLDHISGLLVILLEINLLLNSPQFKGETLDKLIDFSFTLTFAIIFAFLGNKRN